MSGIELHFSNRSESLVEILAEHLSEPNGRPLQPELILIQSKAMERYLSLELADRLGIAANLDFVFPEQLLKRLLARPNQDRFPFGRASLAWMIFDLLPELRDRPGFEDLRAYPDLDQERRCYRLALRIAALFDRYLIYRFDWIEKWTRGETESQQGWQPLLWRALLERFGQFDYPGRRRSLVETIAEHMQAGQFPERMLFFGISHLPPLYVQVLAELSAFIPIVGFSFAPDATTLHDSATGSAPTRDQQATPNGAPFPGEPTASFLRLLRKHQAHFVPHFQKQTEPPSSALNCLQARLTGAQEAGQGPIADRSVSVHNCHSAHREVQVLFDWLHDAFAADPGLKPHEIVVLCPRISDYAPYIHAVFGNPEEKLLELPYSVSDSTPPAAQEYASALQTLLGLRETRVATDEILALLELEPVQKRIGFENEDLSLIRSWVEKAGIRWGFDAEHRAALNLPHEDRHSWRRGLDRLLLGVALPTDSTFAELPTVLELPHEEALLLARLSHFLDGLQSLHAALQAKRPVLDWVELVRQTAKDFLYDARGVEAARLEYLLREAGREIEETGIPEKLACDSEVFLDFFLPRLEERSSASGFLEGAITFSALLPMRTIPARIVCLIGMNEGVFPGKDRRPGFDLMLEFPRPGDPHRPSEDRLLFLETVLACRERLFISYCGQSARTGRLRPPSVLVQEISEILDGAGPSKTITGHRLQAFHPDYFETGGALFSYSRHNFTAARGLLLSEAQYLPVFVPSDLRCEGSDSRLASALTVSEFARFFMNPARAWLHHNPGLRLPRVDTVLSTVEPLEAGGLVEYQTLNRTIRRALSGRTMTEEELLEDLPHGNPGLIDARRIEAAAASLLTSVRREMGALAGELPGGELKLHRHVLRVGHCDLFQAGTLFLRAGQLNGRDLLEAWMERLVRAALRQNDSDAWLFGRREIYRITGPREAGRAQDMLLDLEELHQSGHERLLNFAPRTAFVYARALSDGQDPSAALRAAREQWHGRFGEDGGESREPHFQLAFRHRDFFADEAALDEFAELALRIFDPLLQHLEKRA
ncbi:MAG: exodeoxyribonuclease V subunit gamma [Leptospiraceae bacterium]|nr:exodeoxyribonuclease V subunit gamma [Leptospiraceae bacterium]